MRKRTEPKRKMSDSEPKKLKKCCYIQPPVRESMMKKEEYERPTAPFDDETVYRASYLPIDPETANDLQVHLKKPEVELCLVANVKMDSDTVYNLSYKPVDTKQREDPPWALKNTKYQKPNQPMDLNTIYEHSYRLPGKFVECDEGAPDNLIVTYAEECNDIEGLIQVPGPYTN